MIIIGTVGINPPTTQAGSWDGMVKISSLCDGKEVSSDNWDESYPLEGYSYPVIAIDKKGRPHIAVGVTDYRKDEAEFYFRDAYTGEELDVTKWEYIHR